MVKLSTKGRNAFMLHVFTYVYSPVITLGFRESVAIIILSIGEIDFETVSVE